MEQLKILEIINRWGYLNLEQISFLLNKNNATIDTLVRILIHKKLLRVDQLTRKNIYMLSALGNRKLGKESKTIRINYNELSHQDLLIKWVSKQKDIISYQILKPKYLIMCNLPILYVTINSNEKGKNGSIMSKKSLINNSNNFIKKSNIIVRTITNDTSGLLTQKLFNFAISSVKTKSDLNGIIKLSLQDFCIFHNINKTKSWLLS